MQKSTKKMLKQIDAANPMYRTKFRVRAHAAVKGSIWNSPRLPMHVSRIEFGDDDTVEITFADTDKFCFYKHCRMGKADGARSCYVTLDVEMCDSGTGKPLETTRYNVWVSARLPRRATLARDLDEANAWPAMTTVKACIMETGSPEDVQQVTPGDMKNIAEAMHNITYDREFIQVRACYWAYRNKSAKGKAK